MRPRDVIVVDDDTLMVQLLQRYLRSRGWTVRAFTRSPEALESALAEPPTAVVTDWAMPELGGDELARRLRDALRDDTPRLVLITASRLVAREVEALFDAVLDKPFRLERVADTLTKLTDERIGSSHTRLIRPVPQVDETGSGD